MVFAVLVQLNFSLPETLHWQVKSSGIRLSKITNKGDSFGQSGRGKVKVLNFYNLYFTM